MNPEIKDREILVGVSGGIGAYKTCELVSTLVQAGAIVQAVMSQAASHFIGPLTFEALSHRPVFLSTWEENTQTSIAHTAFSHRCDLFILAPASANTLAKMAHGIADNALTNSYIALPQSTPKLIAPAMNVNMWESQATQNNLGVLKSFQNHHWIGPESGWQACRRVGTGRMSAPEDIYRKSIELLAQT